MGQETVPSVSSLTSLSGGSPALRQVACRAKQARFGAMDEVVETVEMEEMEDDREDREWSDIIDSGLELYELADTIDGRRIRAGALGQSGWRVSKLAISILMTEHIDLSYPLAAGVLEAVDAGVKFGVGRRPILGARSGLGSKKRGGGSAVLGVGVCSGDSLLSSRALLKDPMVGVGVEDKLSREGSWIGQPIKALSMDGMLSSSGVSRGTIRCHVEVPTPADGDEGFGVYRRTMSCHFSKRGLGRCNFHPTLLKKQRSCALISHTLRPDILLQAFAE